MRISKNIQEKMHKLAQLTSQAAVLDVWTNPVSGILYI